MTHHSDKKTYPLSLTLRIDWSEMDEFSHINNLMFMKYIQSARVNYWQQIGLYQYFKEHRIGPMQILVNCRLIQPLFFPGEVTIKTRTVYIKNTSFSFEHALFNEQQELVAEGTDVMVMYDFNRNEKVTFPAGFREAIELLEKRTDLNQ
ncbi:MAG: acyl-CoA thioesterase [Bacteroidia bacterium]|jgi:acyl-CoA thioester hydrolase